MTADAELAAVLLLQGAPSHGTWAPLDASKGQESDPPPPTGASRRQSALPSAELRPARPVSDSWPPESRHPELVLILTRGCEG